MDELLMSRVKQLREVDERLERAMAAERAFMTCRLAASLDQIRRDLADMVRAAEAEHEAF